jgi:hypothetical protein
LPHLLGKREFVLGIGAGAAALVPVSSLGQSSAAGVDDLGRNGAVPQKPREIPTRKATTTKLFLTPPGWPNAIAVDPDGRGFWVAEQRHDGDREAVWLLDWNGKLLQTVMTNSKNTSGMTVGAGCIWSGANGASIKNHPTPPVNGIFQTDFNGTQVNHRQIPFGPSDDGGACHGVAWQNGKLWVSSNRLESLVRVDPNTWQVDWMFPHTFIPDLKDRIHGIEYDDATGYLWQVSGTQSKDVPYYPGYTPKLIKYDIKTGQVAELVEFVPGSCDPHDIAIHNGVFYGVDAGEHPGWPITNAAYQRPGWPPLNSPFSGYVFRINLV